MERYTKKYKCNSFSWHVHSSIMKHMHKHYTSTYELAHENLERIGGHIWLCETMTYPMYGK